MVSVDRAITAGEIENKLRSFIDAMRENSAECATWSKVRDALNAAGNGNYSDLELALTASESTRQTVLDILESYRATVQLGDRFLQAMPGNVAILLSQLTLNSSSRNNRNPPLFGGAFLFTLNPLITRARGSTYVY
jgi:hypothetical protein